MKKKIKSIKEKNKRKFELIQRQYKLVWTDNDISRRLVTPFTARQHKIIDYVVTEIDNQKIKENGKDYVIIRVKDIVDFYTNSVSSGKLLKDFENDIVQISNIGGWWRYDENHPELKTIFRFFQSVDEVEKGNKSILKIGFNEHYLKRLFNTEPRIATDEKTGEVLLDDKGEPIKIGFNKYELNNTKELNGKYSILLYKKCSSWRNAPFGYFDYSVEDIKKDFLLNDIINKNTGEKETISYGYISSHCIKPAQKEINAKTDILISKIELLPNAKRVEKIRIYLHEKNRDKIERKLLDAEERTREKVDIQEEKYKERLDNLKLKTEEKREEKRRNKRLKRIDLSVFESDIKNSDNKDIHKIIKEREEKINKKFNQENIDFFISDKEYQKFFKEQYEAKKEFYKEKGIDYIKYLKAMKEEREEFKEKCEPIKYKEKVEMHKINKRANKLFAFIGKNNLQEEYDEKFMQIIMKEMGLSKEEAKELIEEVEKEINDRTEQIMIEKIAEYDKKHKKDENE